MKYKTVQALHEARMWTVQVIIPAGAVIVGLAAKYPEETKAFCHNVKVKTGEVFNKAKSKIKK